MRKGTDRREGQGREGREALRRGEIIERTDFQGRFPWVWSKR